MVVVRNQAEGREDREGRERREERRREEEDATLTKNAGESDQHAQCSDFVSIVNEIVLHRGSAGLVRLSSMALLLVRE